MNPSALLLPSISLALASVLTGCTTTLSVPPVLPGHLISEERYVAAESHSPVSLDWIAGFGDASLQSLIAAALGNNFSLNASAARVRAAYAQADISSAQRLPATQLALDAVRGDRDAGGNADPAPSNRFQLALGASWEPDLWQRLSHRSRASAASAEATEADFHAARLALAANVSSAWYRLIASRLQRQIASERVDSFEGTRQVIEDRYRNGISSALDLRLARENAAAARTALVTQQRSEDIAKRTLETLLGRYPSGSIDADQPLPQALPPVPAGQPAELLERRPDLRAARLRLIASSETNLDISRNFLPRFTLTAAYGNASDDLKRLLNWDELFWNLAAGITQPLFQGGQLTAQRQQALAQRDEALSRYAGSVLEALLEVESGLVADRSLRQQLEAQEVATTEARLSAELAAERYQAGLTDVVTLLETQRRFFNSQNALIATRLDQLTNRINVHLALGGDFVAPIEVDTRK